MKTYQIKTSALTNLTPDERYFIYNGMDAALTLEVFEKLSAEAPEYSKVPYQLELALQAPAVEMMLRGILVDKVALAELSYTLGNKKAKLEKQLNQLASAVWGAGLNPRSPAQLKKFFYQFWKLPKQYKFDKGVKKLSTDRAALEKLNVYQEVRPFISHINATRDATKQLGVLRTPLQAGRMRSAFNIGGTETGRWSSSGGAYGGGTNIQNITKALRHLFRSDPGYKLAYIDLEQAESRMVGGLVYAATGDTSYIDACESGDLHTFVTKLIWPGLTWGDDDREIADQLFYLHYSYRDMAKRGGHGTNYYGKPPTMAKHLKVPVGLVEHFQSEYFKAFPGIPRWHKLVAQELQTTGFLQTPFSRGRHFFGRLTDEATLRKAIAFLPQSSIADYLNTGMLRVWKQFPEVQLLAQEHDAILVQYPKDLESELIPKIEQTLMFPVQFKDRELIIPVESCVGWNWGNHDKEANPNGLVKWRGCDAREETIIEETPFLDRRIL